MRPLAEALAAAGLTVDLPLLPGHGTDISDLIDKRWSDWSAAAAEALDALEARCESVVVAGLSMGGTLACWLAEHRREIRGLAVVNPMVEPPDESVRDLVKGMLDSGETVAPGIGSDIAKPDSSELAYPGLPLEAALSFFEGVDEVSKRISDISCPVLLFTSRQDHVVPPSSSDLLSDSVSGPVEQIFLERSFHVATLDYDAPEITKGIVEFALEHTSSSKEVPTL
jgi:carboxylesterase